MNHGPKPPFPGEPTDTDDEKELGGATLVHGERHMSLKWEFDELSQQFVIFLPDGAGEVRFGRDAACTQLCSGWDLGKW